MGQGDWHWGQVYLGANLEQAWNLRSFTLCCTAQFSLSLIGEGWGRVLEGCGLGREALEES